jgi:hypothetical protein
MSRECLECTRCCEGWLSATVHEYDMYPGNPCHYLCQEKNCTIYENRPQLCKDYRCVWLDDEDIPEWIKPSYSGVIITNRKTQQETDYLEVVECGFKIDSEVLNNILLFAINRNLNLRYQLDGQWFYYGSKEFCQQMQLV